jgi:hypothetical protein
MLAAVSIISRPTDTACAIRSSMRKACALPPGSSKPMQSRHCYPAQASRHALDRSRLQRDHCSPLCQAQWSFSGLLGTQNGTNRRMTRHFLVVQPAKSAKSIRRQETVRRTSLGAGRVSCFCYFSAAPVQIGMFPLYCTVFIAP